MNIVDSVKKEVTKIAPDSEVILFGSRARGDFKEKSDWDFLILLNKKKVSKSEKEKIRSKLYEIELMTDEVISTIIHSRSEWEKRSVTPIYQIIEEEGKRA
ncbi:MAG: nucleotidyltransferase domain-containing protein [Bacteroidota bacterium]